MSSEISMVDFPVVFLPYEIQDLQALGSQIGIWPKQSAPEQIEALLFPSPEKKEGDGTTVESAEARTFAIMDAAKLPFLRQRLEATGLIFRSLFDGDAAQDLQDVAPYLIELDAGNDFTRRIFTASEQQGDMGQLETGIFCRASASIDQMRRHFRRFTRVQDDMGHWVYFRFWERSLFLALRASVIKPASTRFFSAATIWVYPSFPQGKAWVLVNQGPNISTGGS